MKAEREALEILLSKIQHASTFEEVEQLKFKLRLELFMMFKRFQLIFTQVNFN